MRIRFALILGLFVLFTPALAAAPLSAQSEVDPDRSLLESMIRREQARQSGSKLTPAERRNALVKAIERHAAEAGFEVKATALPSPGYWSQTANSRGSSIPARPKSGLRSCRQKIINRLVIKSPHAVIYSRA
jgi:hypothetical protein